MAVTAPSTSRSDGVGRSRILDVAAELFLRQGFDGTSQRDIATAAGMKAASLYYHFGSKNELLEAILGQGMDVMVRAFGEAAAATARTPGHPQLAAHVRAHLAALYENGPYTAAHVTTFRTAPDDVRRAIVPQRDAYEAMWTELLERMIGQGFVVASTPVGLTRLTLFGAMNTSIEWFDPQRGNLDELATVITNQLWHGIAADRG